MNVQIINKNGEQQIKFTNKVLKQIKKIKGRSDNIYYQAIMPEPLVDVMSLERSLYFHEHENEIRISPLEPKRGEYKEIKLQKLRRFSIPRRFFPFCENKEVVLTYSFNRIDVVSNTIGCLSICLV